MKYIISFCFSIFFVYLLMSCYEYDKYAVPHTFNGNIEFIDLDNSHYKYTIDHINISKKRIEINGWAANITHPVKNFYVKIILINDDVKYLVNTNMVQRPDVENAFNIKRRYVHSNGFYTQLSKRQLKKGSYKVALVFYDNEREVVIPTTSIITL